MNLPWALLHPSKLKFLSNKFLNHCCQMNFVMEIQRRFSLTVLCLTAMLIAPACRAIDGSPAATPKEFGGATPLQWSVRMADSEITRCGDSLAWRPGRMVKWDYAAGLFTLSLLKLNEAVPTTAYVEFSKDAIGSFIADDGKIHGYQPEEYNLIMSLLAERPLRFTN